MMQGDAYSVPVVIKAKDGTVITPEMATRVEITMGHLTRQWPGVITFNEDTLAWEFPLTQQQSFRLSQGKQKTQVRVAFSNGWVVGGDGTDLRVLKSESKSILPAAAQQAKTANVAFGSIFAEIGAITVVLGGSLPDIDESTKGKYLTNDGEKAEWADVDALPAMSSDTAGKMLTNDGDKAEWGFGTPLTVNIASTDNGVTIDQTFQNLLAAIRSNRKIITVINEIETAAVYKVLEDGKRIDIELGFSPPGIEDREVDGARAWLDYYSLYDDEGFSFGSEPLIDGFLQGYTFNAPSTENISGVTIVAKPFPADRRSGTKPRLYRYEASDPLRRCYITDDGSGGYIYKDCLGNEYDPTPFSGGYQIFAMYYNFLSVVYNRRMYYKQDETSEDVSFLSGNGDVIRFGEGGISFFPNSAGSVPKATAADKGKTLTVDEHGYYQLVDPAK